MITGAKPFEGETVSETLAAVILTEPDWDALPQETPPRIRRLIARCISPRPVLRLFLWPALTAPEKPPR